MVKYLILNNNNIVVDIVSQIIYLKTRLEDGFIYIVDFYDGALAILGSDKKTTYKIKDINFSPEDLIYHFVGCEEELLSDVCIGYTKFINFDINNTDIPIFETNIQQIQQNRQEENKQKFNEYLNAHPVTFNNKQYGTTLEDQLEIALVLSQASAAVSGTDESPKVEWHAKNEANEEMSVEDLLALQAKIKEAVDAPYKKMQEYKVAIFDCEDAKTLVEMNFEYEEGATE